MKRNTGGFRKYFPALAMPLLLLLIAVSQFGRVIIQDISPWKGGGFGMFSTLDRPTARTLELYLEFEDHERQFEPAPGDDLWLYRTEALATIVPSDGFIEAFIEQFEGVQWYCTTEYDSSELHRNRCMTEENAREILEELDPDSPEYELLQPVKPAALRAEVWVKTYHGGRNILEQRQITQMRWVWSQGGLIKDE